MAKTMTKSATLAHIAEKRIGMLIYLRQEGRGTGLVSKIDAYALQDEGLDTVEASGALGVPVDARTYDVAAAMLRQLGVESVEIMTNNPAKVDALKRLGIRIERRVPVLVPATPFSAEYLDTKRRLMQHELPSSPLNGTPVEREEPATPPKRWLAS